MIEGSAGLSALGQGLRGRAVTAVHLPKVTAGQAAVADKVAVVTVGAGGAAAHMGETFGGQCANGQGSCQDMVNLIIDRFGVGQLMYDSFHAWGAAREQVGL